MPIRYSGADATQVATFTGHGAPEEADALLEWLRRTPAPRADLAACDGLHMALAQLLLAGRAAIDPPPPDPTLASLLRAGVLAVGRDNAEAQP
jgi:hypothetical protein